MPPWPDRFAATPADRRALLLLSTLRSLPPRKLFDLAARRGSARRCLRAILDGEVGGEADRARLRDASPDAIAQGLASTEARLVVPGGPECPAPLGDLAA